MNDAQKNLYFREWNAVRQILRRQGVSAAECDARRHEFHVQALGAQKSSKKFTNADLDKVLAVFRAITQPGNLDTQVDALEQARRRKIFVLDRLLREIGAGREYAAGICRQMGLSSADPDQLDEPELKKVLVALTNRARRKAAQVATEPSEEDPF